MPEYGGVERLLWELVRKVKGLPPPPFVEVCGEVVVSVDEVLVVFISVCGGIVLVHVVV